MLRWIVPPVYAQSPAAPLCELDDMIIRIFDAIWPFIGLALFFMLLAGGFMWLTSTGDPQRISKATSTILWAIVGTVILALIMVIMGTFEYILGLPEGSLRVLDIPCR